MTKSETLVALVKNRLKAAMALLGILVNIAYAYNVAKPNPYVQSLLTLAGLIGVHQTPNL